MLQRVLHTASRRSFTPYYYDLQILAEKAQYDLFRHSCRKGHCLNLLFTVKLSPSGAMHLRMRGHDYELPTDAYDFNKRNFIVRSLFRYV